MRTKILKTKTFNGCWTCRRRKVKCPGPRPECSRCAKAGLQCDGFDAKLSWSADPPSPAEGVAWRQRIILPRGLYCPRLFGTGDSADLVQGVNVLSSYNDKEATGLLNDLELRSRLPDCNARAGPFSVFNIGLTDSLRVTSSHCNTGKLSSCSGDFTPHSCFAILQEEAESSSGDLVEEVSRPHAVSPLPNILGGRGYSSIQNRVVPLLASSSFTIPRSPEGSNSWIDRLLSHYVLRVADVLQPITHRQNPFRSIYAQYAMGISTKPLFNTSYKAEASLSSHTVIYHSILSTAAFHLRGLGNAKHPEWEFYDRIGRHHRLKALKHLQEAIMEPSLDDEAHCARFSAILTLVTIDLVEGSSTEFLTHLQGCHQVRQLYLSRAPGSSLHRSRIRQLDTISFFLTTIAQTTAHHLSDPWHFPAYSDTASWFETPFSLSDACLEHTYGITSSIASVIYLINKFWHYASSVTLANESFARGLAQALDNIGEILHSWTPCSELFASIKSDDAATLSLARDLASSFYCSTQIYFHSCFKFNPSQCDRSMFSRYSEETLLALERAELGKLSVSRAGASICWPAFVSACEAPPELRNRWTQYWHTLLGYRIGSLQTIWKIVQEVWRKADEEEKERRDGHVDLVTLTDFGIYQTSEPIWTNILRKTGVTILTI